MDWNRTYGNARILPDPKMQFEQLHICTLLLILGEKKGCADGGNNRDYNCQRSEALCSRTLLFIRVEPWRRISFVKLKRTIRQRVLFPLAPGPMLGFIAPLIVFNVKRKCIEDLLIVEENY